MAIPRQRPIRGALLHDQLHVLDPTVEMRVEVSWKRGVCDFVLLVGLIFDVGDVDRVTEDTLGREELAHEHVPVREVVLALGSLKVSQHDACGHFQMRRTVKPLKCSLNCMSFSKQCPFIPSLLCCWACCCARAMLLAMAA